MVNPILHIAVIGFHHKRGGQIEYCYPPLKDSGELPTPWQNLPSLALPDGAHNVDHDVIYFLLPSLDDPNRSVFGISCYRQISAKDLLHKSTDVTRSSVQKSVCVISSIPLFGVLTAKLQLITEAYFNERDFAKVEVLSQMYQNLCEIFPNETSDDQSAVMDISVQSLVLCFKHRLLQLFKLILLEKKIVFYITPVYRLSEMMVALISLFPSLVEEGLFHAADYRRKDFPHDEYNTNDNTSKDDGTAVEVGTDVLDIEILTFREDAHNSNDEAEQSSSSERVDAGDLETTENKNETLEKRIPLDTVDDSAHGSQNNILKTDSFGFPLNIFTTGCLFHPYLSISYLDMIRSERIRAFCIGATNALFLQRREILDVIVTIDDNGEGNVNILNPELKRALTLTSADLRFVDYILKGVEANAQSSSFEGSDDWVRLQTHAYLLSLMATTRTELKETLFDFGETFIAEWKLTNNYRIWSSGDYPDLASAMPGHLFAGGIGLSDVLLRVEHSVGGTESGRRVVSAVANTGKYFSDTGTKVKSSISSWLKGTRPT